MKFPSQVAKLTDTVNFYIAYLGGRQLAARYGKSLRNLDRALWQWSERGKMQQRGATRLVC
jgi:hypothetical protein